MDELHVVFGLNIRDNPYVCDYSFLLTGSEKQEITGANVLHFHFRSDQGLIFSLAGKCDID